MRFDLFSLLILVAVVVFVLDAFGFSLKGVSLLPIGLAAFAAAFLFGRGGLRLG